jgi:hypothetical protein
MLRYSDMCGSVGATVAGLLWPSQNQFQSKRKREYISDNKKPGLCGRFRYSLLRDVPF